MALPFGLLLGLSVGNLRQRDDLAHVFNNERIFLNVRFSVESTALFPCFTYNSRRIRLSSEALICIGSRVATYVRAFILYRAVLVNRFIGAPGYNTLDNCRTPG